MAAGYDPYNLLEVVFEGTRYAGAEVRMRVDVPIDEAMELFDLLFAGDEKTIRDQAMVFGDRILDSWNLQDPKTKKTIPATGEGALKAPPALVRICINQWRKGVFDPSLPLDESPGSTS